MTGRIVAMLLVPQGTHRPEPLAQALRSLHPTWEVGALWCGDPQLRPQLNGVVWLDMSVDALRRVFADDKVAVVMDEGAIVGIVAKIDVISFLGRRPS